MTHLTPLQASAFLQSHPDALFVDCRTEMEFFYVGHPVGATHIAWQEAPEWDINPHFAPEVLREAGSRERPVVLICRSGNRTIQAAAVLEEAGFTQVVNVLHGFEGDLDAHSQRNRVNGWRHDGLPWEQM